MRGILSDKIQNVAKSYLGREISTTELRLYPYIDYCLKNGGYMNLDKVSDEELDILLSYDKKSQLSVGSDLFITVSFKFYNYLQRVLWLSYVGK